MIPTEAAALSQPAPGLRFLEQRGFGLAVVIGLAVCCRLMASAEHVIPDVALALVLGIALRVMLGERAALAKPGVDFAIRYLLRTAIILFGCGLSLESLVAAGAATLALVVACSILALAFGILLARVWKVGGNLGVLIGVGTAICGGSAILAIGPILEASSEEMAYAITTIFTFNIVALFVYPIIGHVLSMSSMTFGSWVGTAVNDTSVVIATGYAYTPDAGSTATIVKLARTMLLIPLSLIISLYVMNRRRASSAGVPAHLRTVVPWFVFGFAGVAALNSLHVLPPALDAAAISTAGFLIVCVLGAVGLNVDIAKIYRGGTRPLVMGCVLASVMAVCSLVLIHALHIG